MIRRLFAKRGDEGSMPLAMLLTVVGIGLTGVLASSLNAQIDSARNTIQRNDAMDAAQSGLEAALGNIRTAKKADGTGDHTLLPCGPFAGSTSGGTSQSYLVTISYLTTEPAVGDIAGATANALPCTGTKLTSGQPLYVFLTSTGAVTGLPKSRVVTATYTLNTKNRENVAGGQIHLYRDTTSVPDLCMAAPSATPAAGAALTMQACDAGSLAQRFAYDAKLNLVLVASRADGSTGMCLDAAGNNSPVLFQPCAPAALTQQWSLNDRSSFEGTTNGTDLNQTCFHLTSPGTTGSAVVLHARAGDPADVSEQNRACYTDYSNARTFTPDAAVGAGRAGQPLPGSTGALLLTQLVNFDQFGRCIDVTAKITSSDFLVVWPCKQSPNGTVDWNQTWRLKTIPTGQTSVATTIYTVSGADNQDYCVLSPGVSGGYVRVTPCTGATTTAITWTRRAGTGVFANTYRIESTFGAGATAPLCLTRTDPAAPAADLWQQGASKTIVQPCDSSAAQKWNASPTILRSSLSNMAED